MVDPQGRHGIYPIEEALRMAREQGLDLVEIAPNANPPVCKIVDYGKFRYEQQKKEKQARKKQVGATLKEIRFRPRTDTHDFEFKVKHAREFLKDGHKVRAWVQFRGRDILFKEQGLDLLNRFMEAVKDVGMPEHPPKMEGRRMSVTITPVKHK